MTSRHIPKECPYCQKKYKDNWNLNRHITPKCKQNPHREVQKRSSTKRKTVSKTPPRNVSQRPTVIMQSAGATYLHGRACYYAHLDCTYMEDEAPSPAASSTRATATVTWRRVGSSKSKVRGKRGCKRGSKQRSKKRSNTRCKARSKARSKRG